MEEIKKMILQLKSMGYRNYQIVNMVESCVGNKKLENLTEQELKNLFEFLATQVDFGLKCLHAAKKG